MTTPGSPCPSSRSSSPRSSLLQSAHNPRRPRPRFLWPPRRSRSATGGHVADVCGPSASTELFALNAPSIVSAVGPAGRWTFSEHQGPTAPSVPVGSTMSEFADTVRPAEADRIPFLILSVNSGAFRGARERRGRDAVELDDVDVEPKPPVGDPVASAPDRGESETRSSSPERHHLSPRTGHPTSPAGSRPDTATT